MSGGSPTFPSSEHSSIIYDPNRLPSNVKRRLRLYSRCISGIELASAYGKIARFVTFTTKVKPSISMETQIQNIRHYWDIMVKRIKRYKKQSFDYIKIIALGRKNDMIHIHCIIVGSGFIPQPWLSSNWHEITGDSYIVDIRIVDVNRVSKKRVAGYLPGYLQQSISRYSRSKGWLPSKYLQVLNKLKKMHMTKKELIEAWIYVLRSRASSPWLSYYRYFKRELPSGQQILS